MTHPPPGDGPFATREQAEAAFAHFAQAAERTRSEPPGEQVVFSGRTGYAVAYLTDTIGYWAPLGAYDLDLIARLAAALDTVDVAVLASWIYRIKEGMPVSTSEETRPR